MFAPGPSGRPARHGRRRRCASTTTARTSTALKITVPATSGSAGSRSSRRASPSCRPVGSRSSRATRRRSTASRTSRARPTATPTAGTATPSSSCPSQRGPQFAAFGGLADGRVSKLGGFVDNLGFARADLPGRLPQPVGAGLCLSPPPLKMRGDVGVEALPTPRAHARASTGAFVYTDAFEGTPVVARGRAATSSSPTRQLGEGSMTFNAWGDIDFELSAEMNLFDVASLSGEIAGWIEPRNNLFNVSGTVKGCLASVICATALGLISSTGVAGCIDAGTIDGRPSHTTPARDRSASARSASACGTIVLPAQGRLRLSVRLGQASTCSATRATSRRTRRREARPARSAAGGTLGSGSRAGTKAVSLRIHGTDGPPKVVLRGPDGTTITSPASSAREAAQGPVPARGEPDGRDDERAARQARRRRRGRSRPPWRGVDADQGRPRELRDAPPTFVGHGAAGRAAGQQELAVAYAVPAGAKVDLVERGKRIARTIARNAAAGPCRRPAPCRRAPGPPCPVAGGSCASRMTFRPSRGPGGQRTHPGRRDPRGDPAGAQARRVVPRAAPDPCPRDRVRCAPAASAARSSSPSRARAERRATPSPPSSSDGRSSASTWPELPRGEDPGRAERRRGVRQGRGRALRRQGGALPQRQVAGRDAARRGPSGRCPRRSAADPSGQPDRASRAAALTVLTT